jgi:hypothetical protein
MFDDDDPWWVLPLGVFLFWILPVILLVGVLGLFNLFQGR